MTIGAQRFCWQISIASRVSFGTVATDARVERFALLHARIQGSESFLQRSVWIESMTVKEINVINVEPLERLVDTGSDVLA